MQVFFTSNDGAGFAGPTNVQEGSTVEEFFNSKFENADPSDYVIQVNRSHVEANYMLQGDDRISVTPRKIEGASK